MALSRESVLAPLLTFIRIPSVDFGSLSNLSRINQRLSLLLTKLYKLNFIINLLSSYLTSLYYKKSHLNTYYIILF
jgi:hypothetical protein